MGMASITIRNLDDDVKTQLRVRAAGNGRSMEEEARLILRHAVERRNAPRNLAAAIRAGLRLSAVAAWNCLRAGRPVGEADCQITAIAWSRGMAVATRNVRDFEDINIEVVDPWMAA